MSSAADSGPNFVLDWHESDDSRRYWRAGIGTLVVHAGIIALVFGLASLSGPPLKQGTEILPDLRQAVHLVLPADLTQKAPNKGKVAKEVNVEDLKPRPPSLERLPPRPRSGRSNRPIPPHPVRRGRPPRLALPSLLRSKRRSLLKTRHLLCLRCRELRKRPRRPRSRPWSILNLHLKLRGKVGPATSRAKRS